jgi:hypothetical protein
MAAAAKDRSNTSSTQTRRTRLLPMLASGALLSGVDGQLRRFASGEVSLRAAR